MDFVVDCDAPKAPDILGARWREPTGDTYAGYNVIVEWAGVTTDVNENVELVEHYEVERRLDDPASSWALVERVAVDDDPDLPFFQFFDEVQRDQDCPPRYLYRVRAVDRSDNKGEYSEGIAIPCPPLLSVVEVEPGAGIGAFPNPFRSETALFYRLEHGGAVEVDVFDVTGKRVRSLERGMRERGLHRSRWDGTDDLGRAVPAGVYFHRVTSGGTSRISKLVRNR